MKKIVALLLAACLTLGCASALAAGKLTVNQETYTAVAGYSFVGYVFAEVENTGDKNIEFGNGLLEILTADGDPMDSTDIYSMYPSILAPGEKLSLIHISEPTRQAEISYAVFCLKKKK